MTIAVSTYGPSSQLVAGTPDDLRHRSYLEQVNRLTNFYFYYMGGCIILQYTIQGKNFNLHLKRNVYNFCQIKIKAVTMGN